MSAPATAPQTAAADFWNRLKGIGRDDGVELDRIIWQLRKLAARQPFDFLTRLAFAWALLMRGHRNEALPHVEAAYGLRNGQGWSSTLNLAGVLLDCGHLVEAGSLLTRLLDTPEAVGHTNLCSAAMGFAMRTGDVQFLRRSLDATRIHHEESEDFVAMIERSGFIDALRCHQKRVEALLGPVTCTFSASIDYDDEGILSANLDYHTVLTGRPRLELYRPLAEATMGDDLLELSHHVVIGICGPQVQSIENAA